MLRLPNAELAYVPPEKLADYALNPEHPVGKHKALVFKSALGLTRNDAAVLERAILAAIQVNEARLTLLDEYGQRFEVEFEWKGKQAVILTAWIWTDDEPAPHLTSCYVK